MQHRGRDQSPPFPLHHQRRDQRPQPDQNLWVGASPHQDFQEKKADIKANDQTRGPRDALIRAHQGSLESIPLRLGQLLDHPLGSLAQVGNLGRVSQSPRDQLPLDGVQIMAGLQIVELGLSRLTFSRCHPGCGQPKHFVKVSPIPQQRPQGSHLSPKDQNHQGTGAADLRILYRHLVIGMGQGF